MPEQHGERQDVYASAPFAVENHSKAESPRLLSEEDQSREQVSMGQGSIAYELLLLQQRLAAYEQLHQEEMAELRQEIERLRRAFLQETTPRLRVVSSPRQIQE